MTWTELGSLGELVGAVAVVVSLIYLSRQVRQNTRAVTTGNEAAVQSNFQALARVFYTDREMGQLILEAMSGETDLSEADQFAAFAYFFDMLKTAEVAYLQFLRGELDPGLWNASLAFYAAYFDSPGFRAYWANRQAAFTPEFQKAMKGWQDDPGPLERTDRFSKRTLASGLQHADAGELQAEAGTP